jgi:hypothetical protein
MAAGNFLPDPPLPSAIKGYRQEERFADNGLRRLIRHIGESFTEDTLSGRGIFVETAGSKKRCKYSSLIAASRPRGSLSCGSVRVLILRIESSGNRTNA